MNSCYNYVRSFESYDTFPPYTWLVIRLDGRHFGRFAKIHEFRKPNEPRALALANKAAEAVFNEFQDISLAYGHSDEFSFLLRADSNLYNRRKDKILTGVVSIFSSAYVYNWNKYFEIDLKYSPSFDGRIVPYPLIEHVKDYFRWRQVDCHVNNQYNTAFWCLVSQNKSTEEAYQILKGTDKGIKNNILYETSQLNYDNLPKLFKKGSTLIRNPTKTVTHQVDSSDSACADRIEVNIPEEEIDALTRLNSNVELITDDIIQEDFWTANFFILNTEIKPKKLKSRE